MSFSLEQHDSYQPNYFKQIEYSVTNLGTTSGNDFSIEYYLSEDNVFDPGDFLLDTERFSSISTEIQPGETKSLSDTKYYLDFPLTSGEYYVIVNLNSDHAVEEKDYSNNVIVSASPFLITEPVIHYVELESASVPAKVSEQDTKFDVELVFNNTSPGDYDWEVRATFRLFNSSGVEIGLIYNDPYVRADQGKVVTVEHSLGLSQKLSPGNYTLQISMGGKTITTSVRAGDNLLLSGEVKGDDGTSITRGVLHLYEKLDLSLRHVKSIAVTGSSYYELDIHPKNYTLYFVPDKTDHPQFVPTIYDKALQVSEADYFATTADLSLDVEVLKLKPIAAGERSIVGQLTSGANSEGTVASIDDLAVRLVNSNNEPVGLTYTDAEGWFDFTGLPEGNYSIIIGNVNVDELITHSISVEVLEYDLSIVIDWETHISQVKFKPILSLTPFPAKIFGDAPFQPEINTSSSQVVTLESSDPDVAIIEDGVITITGAGTATITARQEETDDFTSAVSQQELKVEKAEQTISFTLLPEVTIADGTIELEATTTFGLPVIFTSQHPEIASIEGNLVTIHAVGVTEITAVQEGDQNVKAAPEVTRTLKVNAVLGIDADNFIRAYPNPTSGKINISGMDHIHSVIVINTLGKRIELPLEDGTIDLSDHTAGVYLVQVKTTSRLNSIRVIRK